jgi:6,7-dimethyl-8-ribityllumazine synthase
MTTLIGTTQITEQPIAIVCSQFNADITDLLLEHALARLVELGYAEHLITSVRVPGAVEIGFAALRLAKQRRYGAIICLGAIVKGETAHFEYVSQACVSACNQVMLQENVPVINGVLTTFTQEQAMARADGRTLNMGMECVNTALQMMDLATQLATR